MPDNMSSNTFFFFFTFVDQNDVVLIKKNISFGQTQHQNTPFHLNKNDVVFRFLT
jgi:hypothetical protein